jgi:putative transposase
MDKKKAPPRLPLPLQFLPARLAVWIGRHQHQVIDYLLAENRVLRARHGQRLKLTNADRRRLAVAGRQLGYKALRRIATIATPETFLRWYRQLVAKKHDGEDRRRPGRPSWRGLLIPLVVRMARENPRWGYTRIMGALKNQGHKVGRNTIRRILIEAGIDPAASRGQRMAWATSIRVHADSIAAMDFFTVYVVTWLGLVRYHVLFAIDLATRKVDIAGISRSPGRDWIVQVARNLLDAQDEFLRDKRYLILDRDPAFTAQFRDVLLRAGVSPIRLPPRSPNLNAFAERFVPSIKSECLNRIVPLGESHLRRAISEYMRHYHAERFHQGLGGRLIERPAGSAKQNKSQGKVVCRSRLGGMLNFYHREAA